jgi:hypothetical protein
VQAKKLAFRNFSETVALKGIDMLRRSCGDVECGVLFVHRRLHNRSDERPQL